MGFALIPCLQQDHVGDFSVLVPLVLPPSYVQSHCLPFKAREVSCTASLILGLCQGLFFHLLFVIFSAVSPSTCDEH